eukprot:1159911-Pelagomonas_calceolata.AAC.14
MGCQRTSSADPQKLSELSRTLPNINTQRMQTNAKTWPVTLVSDRKPRMGVEASDLLGWRAGRSLAKPACNLHQGLLKLTSRYWAGASGAPPAPDLLIGLEIPQDVAHLDFSGISVWGLKHISPEGGRGLQCGAVQCGACESCLVLIPLLIPCTCVQARLLHGSLDSCVGTIEASRIIFATLVALTGSVLVVTVLLVHRRHQHSFLLGHASKHCFFHASKHCLLPALKQCLRQGVSCTAGAQTRQVIQWLQCFHGNNEKKLTSRPTGHYGYRRPCLQALKGLQSKCLTTSLSIRKGGAHEDRVLLEGHQKYGNKWTKIAEMVGGRTDNAVKDNPAVASLLLIGNGILFFLVTPGTVRMQRVCTAFWGRMRSAACYAGMRLLASINLCA